jgi:hypothetical protein
MTIQTLLNIRTFLTRVVAKGPEEQALLNAIAEIDKVVEKHRPKAA